jgi:Barstar (barnase inhibitor)
VTQDFVWLQEQFPWLGPGFIHAIDDDYAGDFAGQLGGLGFELLRMQGDSGDSVFAQLESALQFPDYYGGSGWDAVEDCLTDVRLPRRGALFWRRADIYAQRDLKRFGEACAVLTNAFVALEAEGSQVVLVLAGRGTAFSRP